MLTKYYGLRECEVSSQVDLNMTKLQTILILAVSLTTVVSVDAFRNMHLNTHHVHSGPRSRIHSLMTNGSSIPVRHYIFFFGNFVRSSLPLSLSFTTPTALPYSPYSFIILVCFSFTGWWCCLAHCHLLDDCPSWHAAQRFSRLH